MKKHYATRYKERIHFLEKTIAAYYHDIRNAKESAGIPLGVDCIESYDLCGKEERLNMSVNAKELKKIIECLPEWDCGC